MSSETFDNLLASQLAADRGDTEPAMSVDVEGFEGPRDLLLALARQQKVDLAKISILALADQYLIFVEEARKMRLELAADYLVMAAWLAYLKSRLLLPEAAPGEGPSAEDMALALAYRLRRLDGKAEAHLIALTRMEPPHGHRRWTVRLLASEMVVMGHVGDCSKTTVHDTLKKMNLSLI